MSEFTCLTPSQYRWRRRALLPSINRACIVAPASRTGRPSWTASGASACCNSIPSASWPAVTTWSCSAARASTTPPTWTPFSTPNGACSSWAHAACLIPVEDYPYFVPTLLARRERPLQPWIERRLGDDPEGILDAVLEEVRERGPLASRDFEDPRDERGTWWDWKPAKTALEILFAQGYLMVDRRVSFQRYYDLAERVLPASASPPVRTMDDYRRWATLRAVVLLGVATAVHASDYYRLKKPATRAMLEALAAEGAVVPVEVEGWKEPAYLDPADLPLVEEIEAGAHTPT